MTWHSIQSRESIEELLTRFGGFHDACLREVHIRTGTAVQPDYTMRCAVGLDVPVRMFFQRQWRDPSAVELLFEQVTGFHLSPGLEGQDASIFEATLELREDGTFFWSDVFGQMENAGETTWVTAKALSWREVSEWMGDCLRYGPAEIEVERSAGA